MSPSPSATRESRVIFSRGEEDYAAADVLAWAAQHGRLATLWSEFAHACECETLAIERELESDDEAISSASVAFRYGHDLITAEETERWLEDRGLTLEDFGQFFERQYWLRTFGGEVAVSQDDFASATLDERNQFVVFLTLCGDLDRLSEQLSFRIAAQAEEGMTGKVVDEAAFQQRLASGVDQKALERELQAMRLNLTRFELETIEVDSRDAAAEVIACVRSDGMEMEEIAEESRYPFGRSEVLLEDLPEEQQQSFLSVRAGALLEPIGRDDGFEVCRVKTRVDPQLSDERIRERLTEQISRRYFSELVSKHIDWKLLQPVSEQ